MLVSLTLTDRPVVVVGDGPAAIAKAHALEGGWGPGVRDM